MEVQLRYLYPWANMNEIHEGPMFTPLCEWDTQGPPNVFGVACTEHPHMSHIIIITPY